MGEESNEDYTPIEYKLKNIELEIDGFYEYTKIGENKIKLRKITCENYVDNTMLENSKCKEFKSDVGSGSKPVEIDLNYDKDDINNPKTRFIMFLKALVDIPDDEDEDPPENIMEYKDVKGDKEQGGKRKTRRHRKNSKKNKSRSSKKRKSNKKKRKTVKKRRLRKQK